MTNPGPEELVPHPTPQSADLLSDTVVVLVHHRNYELIGATARSLMDQGFDAGSIVVVDNSEQDDKRENLHSILPVGIRTVFIPNLGYGNAVNIGVAYWEKQDRHSSPEYVLVATHEVVPRQNAVRLLRSALAADPNGVAAGPTLVSGVDETYIWSTGGRLSRLGIPRHFDHRQEFDPLRYSTARVTKRQWVDGAFVLYRWSTVRATPLDESYFMYMEETDLHLRLTRMGKSVLWVPSATVWQASGGIPAFYLSRNLRLLFERRGQRLLGFIAVPMDVGRRALSDLVKRWEGKDTLNLVRGLTTRLPPNSNNEAPGVVVVNPLAAALKHYSVELRSVLDSAGANSLGSHSIMEPSSSGESRISWVLRYVQALRKVRSGASATRLVVTWPVLGYLDAVIIALVYRRPVWIVMHDPEPLVRAVGYGKLSLLLARLFRKYTNIIVHSSTAHAAVLRQGAFASVTVLPHPILPPRQDGHSASRVNLTRPVIRVLGQYKPDRDLDALRQISKTLRGSAQLEIYGRGWPDVEGWNVTEGFLSEAEMTVKLASADVIVIPYSRFFQSGIAIRALESGVAVVGPRVASLVDLYGPRSPLLVDVGDDDDASSRSKAWSTALDHAIRFGAVESKEAAEKVRLSTVKLWRAWIAGDHARHDGA